MARPQNFTFIINVINGRFSEAIIVIVIIHEADEINAMNALKGFSNILM